MAPSVLALIGATVVFSSFLSGVFGMAGGMVLLGVLLNYFDVATGMILFSIIQLFANGWRVLQWRRYVLWPIFGWYVVGAAISFTSMWMIAFVPDKAMVYLARSISARSRASAICRCGRPGRPSCWRMTDHGFRQWTRAIIFAISAVYLVPCRLVVLESLRRYQVRTRLAMRGFAALASP